MKYYFLVFIMYLIQMKAAAQHADCLSPVTCVFAPQLFYGGCKPYAVYPGQPFKVILGTNQTNVDRIEVTLVQAPWSVNNVFVTTLVLRDDGLKGDEKANDYYFTIDQVRSKVQAPLFGTSEFFRTVPVKFVYTNGSAESIDIDLAFGIRIMPLSYVAPVVKKLSSTAQITSHVLNIVVPLEQSDKHEILTKLYYQHFPDDRDFLVRATTYYTPGGTPAGNYNSVIQEVQGISNLSFTIRNNSALYGSNNKLQGIINLFYTHGGQGTLLNHEILHRYAAFIDATLGITLIPHWTYTVMPSSGFGSGLQISSYSKISDGVYSYKTAGLDNTYSKLELYLMGFLPIDSIPFPIQALGNISNPRVLQGGIFAVDATEEIKVTQTQFFTKMGTRIPNHTNSQKQFKLGLMVTSDRLLTPDEMAYFHGHMREYENTNQSPAMIVGNRNFNSATRGLASITTRISNDLTPVIDQGISQAFSVYPIPANRSINVQYDKSKYPIIKYGILDIHGKSVQEGFVNNKLELKNMPAGVYYLKLQPLNQNTVAVKKLLLVN